MRILIANDDGIEAKGILALVDALKDEHEVYVAAPHRQRSAYSHSVTYFSRHRKAWKREIAGTAGAWAIDATPADCVYYGCFAFLKEMPDLILSGINHGENLSTDCIYSGTVGAASEGQIIGIPSIAVSLCSYTGEDFANAVQAVKELIPVYMADPDNHAYMLNVNVPDLPKDQIKGYKITMTEGNRNYQKPVDVEEQKDGSYLLICDNVPVSTEHLSHQLAGDVTAVKNGYISVTPMDSDLTHHEQIARMKKYEEIHFVEKEEKGKKK
jgi:5'-nucleotidase